MNPTVILWRRIDLPGHDSARLVAHDAEWHLTGTALFAEEGTPCRLDYHVVCDAHWRTRSARVSGWIGNESVAIGIVADDDRRWSLNGVEAPGVEGCIDVDLNFSPSTNLLSIRRLDLGMGEEMEVRAAWLRFPELKLEVLEQRYRRSGERMYGYVSGEYAAELRVNEVGMVTVYPGLWEEERK